jgi:dUTPase
MKSLKVRRHNENARIPELVSGSSMFELRAALSVGSLVSTYNPWNKEVSVPVKTHNGTPIIQIHPGYRVAVPTGLIFDVEENNVLKIHSDVVSAVKHGIMLVDGVNVIDSNHTTEAFVHLYNTSDGPITISHEDVIARAMLERVEPYELQEILEEPTQET